MKKILIVSYYFPPLNIIASKRYGTMCKYFEQYGYKPYILTTKHNRNYIEWDVHFDLKLPVDEEQLICLGKSKENCEVNNKFIKFVLRFIAKKEIMSGTLERKAFGWYEQVKKNIDLEKICDIDIIIGTYPGMENLYVASYLSRKIGCPYIVEVRDLISDYMDMSAKRKNVRWLDRIIEKNILNRASGIVTVTPGFRDILRRRFSYKKFSVVFNGYDGEKNARELAKPSEKYLYYAGSLYLHRLESFRLLVKCLRKANLESHEKIKFIVRSIGPKELDMEAKRIIKRERMQEYVKILEAVPEEIVIQEQRQAYINVVLSTLHEQDAAFMATIPGKLYELLNVVPPILTIVQKNSDVGKVLNYTQKGIASASEEEIINFILKDCKLYTGNRNIDYFTRKRQARRLCKFVDEVLETI